MSEHTFVDIDQGVTPVSNDGFAYFAANDGVHGGELWRSDGTAAGTALVKDFRVGDATTTSNPNNLFVASGRVYFTVASSDDGASALYVVDGAGAPQQITIHDGSDAAGRFIGVVNGQAVFVMYRGDFGYKLFSISSGTTATMISGNYASGPFAQAATLNGYMYFEGCTSGPAGHGCEPWRTDGSTATEVADIHAGGAASYSSPGHFQATTNRVFFIANDGFTGPELWVTDGTEPGTVRLTDHQIGLNSAQISSMTPIGDRLYYVPKDHATGTEPWISDGTVAGTRVVKDITPGVGGSGAMEFFPLAGQAGFFLSSQVWRTDGTEAGTAAIATTGSDGYGPMFPTTVGDKLYFRAGHSAHGSVLWRSDGTETGTFPLSLGGYQGVVDPKNPAVGNFVALGSKLIFSSRFAKPAGSPYPETYRRLYAIDTTLADLVRSATAAPSLTGTPVPGNPLTINPGTWTIPSSFTYRWFLDGQLITNITGPTLNVQTSHVGKTISAQLYADGVGAPGVTTNLPGLLVVAPTATVPPVGPPAAQTLTALSRAKIKGKAKVGKKLTAKPPKFSLDGVKVTYLWKANGKKIKKATKKKLKVSRKLKGKKIQVVVTGRKAGYHKVVSRSRTKKVR